MGGVELPDPVRDRFTGHVGSILQRSAIPAAARDDVAEELLGHLEARYADARASGLASDAAASEAIAGFGAADVIGRDFMTTYHGRLWASTIGQLLPVASAEGAPPRVVVWVVRFDKAMAVFSAIAAIALALTTPPVQAVIGLTLGLLGAGLLWLAAVALRRGQGWAVAVSAFGLFVNAVIFFASLGQPPGGWTVSINGLIGLILLLWLLGDGRLVSGWVAGSVPIRERLGWPIGIALVGWSLVAGFGPRVPDPTQIGPSDIDASASVTCAAVTNDDGVRLIPAPTVVVEIAYLRTDVAPRGVLRDPASWGDTIEVIVDPGPFSLGLVDATVRSAGGADERLDISTIVDRDAGASSGSGPTFAFDDMALDPIVGEILGIDQRVGRTIRIVVPTTTEIGDGRVGADFGRPIEDMDVNIRLTHLDRFVLDAHLACGERGPLLNGADR